MTERWFMKCRKCRKPWAVDIERDPARPYADPLADADFMPCPLCDYAPPIRTDSRGRRIYDYSRRVYHTRMGKIGPTRYGRLLTPEERAPCDGRCTNARGPNCDCRCGGVNHGSQRVVTVWRCADAGRVPA